MAELAPRLKREQATVNAMIALYCHDQHPSFTGLCPACQEMRVYAMARLAHCPFQPDKPTCAKCTVHCYRADMKESMRAVMRYAGPRMLLRHPILAVCHLWDGWRTAPGIGKKIKPGKGLE